MKNDADARYARIATQGGWVGVDLDGTLAEYNGWKGHGSIGAPVPKMLERVKAWRAIGLEVRIFTARAGDVEALEHISAWSLKYIGEVLPVTATKDYAMVELWDDRAVQVVPNTGERADGLP